MSDCVDTSDSAASNLFSGRYIVALFNLRRVCDSAAKTIRRLNFTVVDRRFSCRCVYAIALGNSWHSTFIKF